VAILQKGELLTAGQVDQVLVDEVLVELGAPDLQRLEQLIRGMNGIRDVKKHEQVLQVFFNNGTMDLGSINQFCFDHGIVLNHLQLRRRSLESKFIELTNNMSN
jgi:ABC-2 type transport system ATP-binding protein